MIDDEDREFLAQVAIWVVGAALIVLAGAGMLGLAVRIFGMAAG